MNNNESKLRTYNLFKQGYNQEKYLSLPLPKEDIRIFTKFRISSHNLEIESGRHSSKNKPKIDAKSRFCKICANNQIEDEQHFLITCQKYTNIREILLKHIDNIDTRSSIRTMPINILFKYLMVNKDPNIMIPLIKHIKNCFNIRKAYLESIPSL